MDVVIAHSYTLQWNCARNFDYLRNIVIINSRRFHPSHDQLMFCFARFQHLKRGRVRESITQFGSTFGLIKPILTTEWNQQNGQPFRRDKSLTLKAPTVDVRKYSDKNSES